LVLIFSGTLLCSAFLMFSIQPLLGKLLLPRLGGSPQVWNTCMVFFQTVLFAGYLHAHYSSAYLGLRRQVVAHIAIACLALLTLPIGLANIRFLSDTENPVLWIMITLAVSIGAPMFVISSTAPLLQKWFSHTSHPAAQDPYFLYAASNLGSLLALLGYPFLIEPSLGLQQQSSWLSGGFVLLVMAVVLCVVIFRVHQIRPAIEPIGEQFLDEQQTVPTRRKLLWTVLSFAPSSLLLGVTTYITTDIAAVPLFWVVPLALYLLTFVIAFAPRPPIPHTLALRGQAVLVSLLVVIMLFPALARIWWLLFLHLAAFFITALVCHGELVRSRPSAQHLTQFYLWLSLGGVLGGVFNALVGPVIFNRPVEYSLALILACFLRPSAVAHKCSDLLPPVALLLGLMVFTWAIGGALERASSSGNMSNLWLLSTIVAVAIGVSAALLKFSENRVRFGMGVAAVLITTLLIPAVGDGKRHDDTPQSFRSFFGVYQVYYEPKDDATVLAHGTTIHGAQFRNPEKALSPLTYYHRDGPFRDLFAASADLDKRRVAVIGLGSGALTCYGSASTPWTYYEIDPLIEKIARNPKYFTYLRDCPPRATVVIGDARLMLRRAPDAYYGLIIIDAFSSDAIPTHLLTKEAIAEYLVKLEPNGLLAIHISNRDLNLEPVVGNLAFNSGLAARINQKPASHDHQVQPLTLLASLVVLARSEAHLRALATDASWRPLAMRRGDRLWSDDYVNILTALRYFGDHSQPMPPAAAKPY
jgi:hypothetical protein